MKYVKTTEIEPNPYQPRDDVQESNMQEIAASIKKFGILQPILVRAKGSGYQIIAGERRYRAAIKAGLNEVPVIEKEINDREMLEIALIENVHREDISAIEKAVGFKRLMEEFKITQRELGEVFGMSRPAVANTLRLLELPDSIQKALRRKEISEGHARALLGLRSEKAMENIIRRICSRGMTVRECENLVKVLQRGNKPDREEMEGLTPDEMRFIENMSERLGTRVRVVKNGSGGKIEIEFYNNEDFERIWESL